MTLSHFAEVKIGAGFVEPGESAAWIPPGGRKLIYTGNPNFDLIAMNLHAQVRKGQSAIEYLSTYGWALLAILVVVGAIMQMGVLNPCSKKTPRFTGQGATISEWEFTGTNSLSIVVEPSQNDITLGNVSLVTDSGQYAWTGSQPVSTGQTYTAEISGVNELSSSECLKADVVMTYNTSTIDYAKATGEGKLQGKAP